MFNLFLLLVLCSSIKIGYPLLNLLQNNYLFIDFKFLDISI